MKVYQLLPYGKKITCDCADEECWHQIETEPHGFFYSEDGTDHTHELYEADFTFPDEIEICVAVEIEPRLTDENLEQMLRSSFKVFDMKLPDWIVRMVMPAMQQERSYYELIIEEMMRGTPRQTL